MGAAVMTVIYIFRLKQNIFIDFLGKWKNSKFLNSTVFNGDFNLLVIVPLTYLLLL
jgi:hypothetical protein